MTFHFTNMSIALLSNCMRSFKAIRSCYHPMPRGFEVSLDIHTTKGTMASQITSLTIVSSNVCSGIDQRKRQSSASLAFVQGIHRWPVKSPHKWPVTRKMFPFDGVIMHIHIINFAINVPVHVLAPNGVRASAGTILTTKLCIFSSNSNRLWRFQRTFNHWITQFKISDNVSWNIIALKHYCWQPLWHAEWDIIFSTFATCLLSQSSDVSTDVCLRQYPWICPCYHC